jgi:isopenicillin-N N-acyltransferase like protein
MQHDHRKESEMSSRMHVEIDSTDPFERGRQRGAQVAAPLQATWPIYQSLFAVTARDAGRDPVDISAVAHACLDALSPWSPDLLRELEGVSAGTGLPLTTVMALNARTEVFAVAGGTSVTECSTIVETAGTAGTALSAQTWDWHEELAHGWHLQTVRKGERSYVGLSEFGMLAKIGVNSAGLGIHFNLLRHVSDAQPGYDDQTAALRGGVPVHLVAAAILGSADTVGEALDLVRSAPIAASTVITVVTPEEAACLEMSAAGVGVVEPSDGWLVHTNHFLDPRLAEGEAVTEFVTTTFEREDLLRSRVKAVAGPQDVEELTTMLCAHDEDGASVCRHPGPGDPHGYRSATLATVALDVERRQAHVFEDGPCRRSDVAILTAGV